MCGRFISGADEIAWSDYCEILRLPTSKVALQSGDRAPSQGIQVVRQAGGSELRELVSLRWGLIAPWVKELKKAPKLINVRSETARTKFRAAFERGRCIIPTSGFYEWKKPTVGKKKIPYLIRDHESPILSMAGLWSQWTGPEDEAIESCAILTTEPCEVVRPIHDRMPALLSLADASLWLEPEADPSELERLLVPYEACSLIAEPLAPEPPIQGELF
jgi:putative SOS response-associated peptidase YedK